MSGEYWFLETFDSHTNKTLWGEAQPDSVRLVCVDGRAHDLLPVSKKTVQEALLSKADQHLLFDVFCQVGFARPKRVNPEKKNRGSKKYLAAAKALKGQMTRKGNKAAQK